MKEVRGIVLSFFIVSLTFAQVPNGSFENWTSGQPDDWNTSNVNGQYINITRTTDKHSGFYALKGSVINTSLANPPIANPFIRSGTNGDGFPIDQLFAKIEGYYQFSSDSGDIFIVNVNMMKTGKQIAYSVDSLAPSSSYKLFSYNIKYLSTEVPDTCVIYFIILGSASSGIDYHVGSYFILDDISLSGIATAVKSNPLLPLSYSLYQNYPNPFNPSTVIEYSIPKSGIVLLTVYNVLGIKVGNLVNMYEPAGKHQINFNASNLSSGVYFYKLQVNNFFAVKKFVHVK